MVEYAERRVDKTFDLVSKKLDKLTPCAIVAWITVAVAGFIALSETDRLIGHAVARGYNATIGEIVGPNAFRALDAWRAWETGLGASGQDGDSNAELLRNLIVSHTAFDLVFVAAYGVLVWRLIDATMTCVEKTADAQSVASRRYAGYAAKWSLTFLIVAEVIEAGLLVWSAVRIINSEELLATAVALFATGKWLAVLALILSMFRVEQFRLRVWSWVSAVAHALWVQRLSVVVLVVLVVATLVPLPGPLDQFPDALRRWISSGWEGAWQLVAAAVAYALTATGLILVGRMRADRGFQLVTRSRPVGGGTPDRPGLYQPAVLWWWVPVPTAVVVCALALFVLSPQRVDLFGALLVTSVGLTVAVGSVAVRRVETPRRSNDLAIGIVLAALYVLLCFVAAVTISSHTFAGPVFAVVAVAVVPLVAAVIAAVVASYLKRRDDLVLHRSARESKKSVLRMLRVAELLGLAVVLIVPLSFVRAYTAPAVLYWSGETSDRVTDGRVSALLFVGWFLAVLIPRQGDLVLYISTERGKQWWKERRETHKRVQAQERRRFEWTDLLLPGVSAGVIAVFATLPLAISGWIGVVATAVAALGAWAILLGGIIVALQRCRPPEIFGLFRMKATPVLSLTAVVLLSAAVVNDVDVHRVRTLSDGQRDLTRASLASAFDDWLGSASDCDRPTADGTYTVRPLLVVAASGGGIRAAVWTGNSMTQIARMGACGSDVVFASSGVSGGSIGLAVARQLREAPQPDSVRDALRRLAEPQALSAGIEGTVVGDLVASATGIRAQLDPAEGWHDRAGLMEMSWEREISELGKAFDSEVAGPTGALIFNSTAAQVKCRVLVSQIDLGPEHAGKGPDCGDADGAPASSIDLYNSLPGCFPDLTWTTAAMLSARFPVVTPSGRVVPAAAAVDNCDAKRMQMQLIDGGYADGTGLGTIAEIAPQLATLVREHNAWVVNGQAPDAATDGAEPQPRTLVVPLVVYLDDEPGVDRVPDQTGAAPELLVPLAGLNARSQLSEREAYVQRISNVFAGVCPDSVKPACEGAVQVVRQAETAADGQAKSATDGFVLTASPPAGPAVEVPLGWTLSDASLDRLQQAVGVGAAPCPAAQDNQKDEISSGIKDLAQLLC